MKMGNKKVDIVEISAILSELDCQSILDQHPVLGFQRWILSSTHPAILVYQKKMGVSKK